jgi:cobalt-zinc-cadmium efflux system outer membrane protein
MSKRILYMTILAVTGVQSHGASEPLALDEAIAEALSNNAELRVLEAAVESARGTIVTASTWGNPEFSATPGVKRADAEGGNETAFHLEVEIVQPILSPGKRAVQKAAAEANVELQEIGQDALRWQLRQNVQKEYWRLTAATRLIELRREQVESSRLFAEAARLRAQSGYASDFESARSAAEWITARKALKEAEAVAAGLRASLNTLLGRESTSDLTVSGSMGGNFPQASASACIEAALSSNLSLRMSARQAAVADLSMRAARLERRPDFGIGPSAEYTEEEQVIGLRVSLPLPIWDRKKGVIATAAAEQQKAWADVARVRAEIVRVTAEAAARYEAARDAAGLYTPEFLDRLKASVAQAEHGLANNATTLLVYLEAKQAYFDTLSDYYETLSSVAESRADLESAMGCALNDLTNSGGKP